MRAWTRAASGKEDVWLRWLYWFSTSQWFEKTIIFIFLLNIIFILSFHYPKMPTGLEAGLRYHNIRFTRGTLRTRALRQARRTEPVPSVV